MDAHGASNQASHDAAAGDAEIVAIHVEVRLENGSSGAAGVTDDEGLLTSDAAHREPAVHFEPRAVERPHAGTLEDQLGMPRRVEIVAALQRAIAVARVG